MQAPQESPAQQGMLTLLDEAPMTPIHYWLWLLACGGTLLDGFSIFALGVALPLIVQSHSFGGGFFPLVGVAIVLGAMVGAGIGGVAADRWGRKPLMLADMFCIAIGAALAAVASDSLLLFAGQLLVGVGIGIDFPVGAAYISELMPKRQRGRMMVAAIACQSLGMLLAAGLLISILAGTTDPQVWRVILGLNGALALLFLLLRLTVPESVRWYLSRGRNAEAGKVLGRLMPAERERALALAAEAGTTIHHVALVPRAAKPPGLGTLFRREYLRRTILVSLPWFLMDVATYGVGMFTPVILGAIRSAPKSVGPVAADLVDAEGSGAIDLFLLVGFLLGLWAVPQFGRIRMQLIGFGGMATGMLILLASTRLAGGPAQHLAFVFCGFILFNLLMNAGPNATTFTLAPELFPTQLRASAGGFAAGVAKAGAALGVFAVPILKLDFGIPVVLGAMAGVSFLGLLVTAVFAHGVEEGVPLEAHQRVRPDTAVKLD